ncbi:synaptophysin-like isoform X2 [Portunus trituberculatus]|uniref:synaptophysin-like isoform X2 n=1 Tax=Portunus trituberculatus TaxID=210409 RepID=UPI001E1CDAE3|nr:synaptophysin-like isoform X2 [Portunus trituberculatus]
MNVCMHIGRNNLGVWEAWLGWIWQDRGHRHLSPTCSICYVLPRSPILALLIPAVTVVVVCLPHPQLQHSHLPIEPTASMEPMPMQYEQQPPPAYMEQPKMPLQGILAQANLGVLKEPRGFIKVLEFVFSICAFATTTSFSSYFTLQVLCTPSDEKPSETFTGQITYPFQIDRIQDTFPACNASEWKLYVEGDFSSDAKFFVAVGVLAFLYVLVALGLYCFFNALYENNDLVPIGDFALHVIFAILWFAASCAWANSLTGLRNAAELDNILKYNDVCKKLKCVKVAEARFGKLISSVIFGFLNVFIWASNLWFLYKETRFYKDRKAGEATNATN